MVAEVLRFLLVGCTNTAIDIAVFNWLSRAPFGFSRVHASIASTTLAMSFSLFGNGFFVFDGSRPQWMTCVTRFVPATVFSAYIVQTLVIAGLSNQYRPSIERAQRLFAPFPLLRSLSNEFVSRNFVKVVAVFAGLFCNYLAYKYFVFV
jgi:putative flippase GtrA